MTVFTAVLGLTTFSFALRMATFFNYSSRLQAIRHVYSYISYKADLTSTEPLLYCGKETRMMERD